MTYYGPPPERASSLQRALDLHGQDLDSIEIKDERYKFDHSDTLEEYGQKVGFNDSSYLRLKRLADNAGNKDRT